MLRFISGQIERLLGTQIDRLFDYKFQKHVLDKISKTSGNPNRLAEQPRPVISIDPEIKQFTLKLKVDDIKQEDLAVHILNDEVIIQAGCTEVNGKKECEVFWSNRLPFGLTANELEKSLEGGVLTITGTKKTQK